MGKPAQVHDQTMDEILASIRRMISEEGALKSGLSPKPTAVEPPPTKVSPLFAVATRGPEIVEPVPAEPALATMEVAAPEPAESPLPDAGQGEPDRGSEVVELAIDQAIEEAKAEIEAETAAPVEPKPVMAGPPGAGDAPTPGAAALAMRASV